MSSLTEVGNFYDPEEAYCAWGYLNANGVRAIIQNEYHLTSAPWMRVALGGYRLLAPIETKPVVEELFAQIDSKSDAGRGESDYFDQNVVKDNLKNRKPNWVWFPVAFLTEVPFVPKRRGGVIGVLQCAGLAMLYGLIFNILLAWYFWFFI